MKTKKLFSTDNYIIGKKSEYLNRFDRLVILILTSVYSIIALLNLGTLSFPVSVFYAKEGDSVELSCNGASDIGEIWVNANICNSNIQIVFDNGEEEVIELLEGNMFEWHVFELEQLDVENIMLYFDDDTRINEIAVFDSEGSLLPVKCLTENGEMLIDEQDTVPDYPSYYNGMYFDEIYHARTAYEYLHGMPIYEWTHPPLGKLIIGIGILIFGMKPFGWRIMGALFGIAMLPIMYLFGKRFFKRSDYALLTAGLMAFDCMHYTQTRIATIDVYGVFFIILMFFFMYEFIRLPYFLTDIKSLLKPLLWCGLSFGAGCASKWIGCYAGVGLAIVLFSHLIKEYLLSGKEKELKRLFINKTVSVLLHCGLFFVIFPAIIYYLSYIPYYVADAADYSSYGFKDTFKTLFKNQSDMFGYHNSLTASHMCQSKWYQWPFTAKSVWFYVSAIGDKISNISSTGNPAVWWISSLSFIGLILERIMKKVKDSPELFIIIMGVFANLLPWTLVNRCVFLYHFFATVPFIILAGVYLLYHFEEEMHNIYSIKWIWLAVAVVYFLLLFPAISGLPISRAYAGFLENTLPSSYLFYGWV